MTDTDQAVEGLTREMVEFVQRQRERIAAMPPDSSLVATHASYLTVIDHLLNALAAADGGEVERLTKELADLREEWASTHELMDRQLDEAMAVVEAVPDYMRLANEIVGAPSGAVTLAMASALGDARRKLSARLAALHADKEGE